MGRRKSVQVGGSTDSKWFHEDARANIMAEIVQRAGNLLSWGHSRMGHDDPNAGPSLRGVGLTRTFGSGDALTTALSDVAVELCAQASSSSSWDPPRSGKSTLLAVLSGLLHSAQRRQVLCTAPCAGSMEHDRKAARGVPPGALRFHFPGLQPIPLAPDGPAAARDDAALGRQGLPARRKPGRNPTKMLDLLRSHQEGSACGPRSFPAAKSSAWPSAGRSSKNRPFVSPTSRPAPSTGSTANR